MCILCHGGIGSREGCAGEFWFWSQVLHVSHLSFTYIFSQVVLKLPLGLMAGLMPRSTTHVYAHPAPTFAQIHSYEVR